MTNTSGQILLETFAELPIELINVGCVPTFRGRGLGSIVDQTKLSTSLARGIIWRVSEHYTHRNHQVIFLVIRNGGGVSRVSIKSGKARIVEWSTGAFEQETFLAALEGGYDSKGTALEKVSQLCQQITEAYDSTMLRCKVHYGRKPNYWWK